MKKTIISIIGIAVMLLAITACRPNYVIVPIPGGGTSSTPSGTPVSDAGELQEALAKGEDVYLTKDVVLPEGFQIPENSTIDGDDKTITVPTGTNPGTGIMDLAASGVTLKNVTLDFTAQSVTGASLLSATARAAGDKFAVLIGSGDENNAPSGITLSNVTIKTGGTIAGINVHTAKNVTLEDITIDYCQKAPISISSSTVTIDGLEAGGSDWYGDKNIIQINGVGGSPAHKASTVTFASTKGIDGIWMEAVEAEYVNDGTISDENFQKDGQSVVKGLPFGWAIRYSNQPSKKTEGWMFYAPDEDATTFTLNEKAADPEADLLAMLDAVAKSSDDHKYSTIKLASNINVKDTIIVTSKVTLDLNEKTLSNTEPIWVDVEDGNEDRWSIISVRENGDLTITGNGIIDALEDDCYAFDVVDGSHLVIENGEFIGNVSAVYVNEGKAEIKGGKYSIKQLDQTYNDERFLLNLFDANREAGTAEIVVTGGTFVKFNPEDNLAEGEGTDFVPDDYVSEKDPTEEIYTVSKA